MSRAFAGAAAVRALALALVFAFAALAVPASAAPKPKKEEPPPARAKIMISSPTGVVAVPPEGTWWRVAVRGVPVGLVMTMAWICARVLSPTV